MERPKNNPLVSVIIPAYNQAAGLARAIQSVIRQTYADLELIVVDDCSSDDTEKAVKRFKDERIGYVRQPQNKGAAAARNTGIGMAKGDLIAFLDSDDEFLPDKLKIQIEILSSLPEDTGLIICDLDDADEYRPGKNGQRSVAKKPASGHILPSSAFPASVFLPPSTWLLRRSCLNQVVLFDEMIFGIEDADYFARILGKSRIYYLNRVLSLKHIRPGEKRRFSRRYYRGKEYFLNKHFAKMKKDRCYLARFYLGIAKDFLSWEQPRQARKYLLKTFVANPRIDYLFKFLTCAINE